MACTSAAAITSRSNYIQATTAKLWKDLWSAGQGVATIHDAPAVATLVSRIADEYDTACRLGPSQSLRRSTTAA